MMQFVLSVGGFAMLAIAVGVLLIVFRKKLVAAMQRSLSSMYGQFGTGVGKGLSERMAIVFACALFLLALIVGVILLGQLLGVFPLPKNLQQ